MVSVILVFFLAEGLLSLTRKIVLERRIHGRVVAARLELGRLRDENRKLKNEKEALYTPEKIEQLAREKLDLARPDEIAVKVITRNASQEAPQQQEKTGSPAKGIWEKIKEELPLKWLLKLEPS